MERDHLEDVGIDGMKMMIMVIIIITKMFVCVWRSKKCLCD